MKQYLVDEGTLQAILNYMAGRPYNEVFKLIERIQTNSKVVEAPAEEKKNERKGK